jgi:hypothetical protein
MMRPSPRMHEQKVECTYGALGRFVSPQKDRTLRVAFCRNAQNRNTSTFDADCLSQRRETVICLTLTLSLQMYVHMVVESTTLERDRRCAASGQRDVPELNRMTQRS